MGFLAGFLGIGGDFLIVPSLVLFLQMPMKLAPRGDISAHNCGQ